MAFDLASAAAPGFETKADDAVRSFDRAHDVVGFGCASRTHDREGRSGRQLKGQPLVGTIGADPATEKAARREDALAFDHDRPSGRFRDARQLPEDRDTQKEQQKRIFLHDMIAARKPERRVVSWHTARGL